MRYVAIAMLILGGFVLGLATHHYATAPPSDVVKEEPMVLEFSQLLPYRFKDGGRGWSFQYPVPQGVRWWEKRFFIPQNMQVRAYVTHWCLRDLDDENWTPDTEYPGHSAANEHLCDGTKAYINCTDTPKDRRFAVVLLFRDGPFPADHRSEK